MNYQHHQFYIKKTIINSFFFQGGGGGKSKPSAKQLMGPIFTRSGVDVETVNSE